MLTYYCCCKIQTIKQQPGSLEKLRRTINLGRETSFWGPNSAQIVPMASSCYKQIIIYTHKVEKCQQTVAKNTNPTLYIIWSNHKWQERSPLKFSDHVIETNQPKLCRNTHLKIDHNENKW